MHALCYFTNTSQVRHQVKCQFFEFKPWNSEVLVIAVLSFWYIIRSLKQRCFGAMDVNQKWGLFPFDMPWQYHICIAKCLYSYRDYLPENLDKTTATIGTLSIDDERDDNNKLCRERTGSRMSFMVGKFESSDYDLASFWPVNLFALPKAGKHKKESFIATHWCLFSNTYINQFSGVFSTKIQGRIRRKSNTQLRWNFFQESGFGGGG